MHVQRFFMGKWDEILGRKFRSAFDSASSRRAGGRDLGKSEAFSREAFSIAGAVVRTSIRIFKDNCLALPWIRERDELDASIQGARADLLRSWHAYQESLRSRRDLARVEADWRQVLRAFRRHVADLNRRIATYNLKAPSNIFRRNPLNAESEIDLVTRDR